MKRLAILLALAIPVAAQITSNGSKWNETSTTISPKRSGKSVAMTACPGGAPAGSGCFVKVYGDGSALTGVSGLPDQTGNADKALTTNGSAASWTAAIPICKKYTVAYNNAGLTGAGATADITLFTAPAQMKSTGVTIKHTAAFSGTGITGVTVSVGWSGSTTAYTPAFDVLQATGDTVMQDSGGHYSPTFVSHAVTARFTASGANLSALGTGSVDIWFCSVTLP